MSTKQESKDGRNADRGSRGDTATCGDTQGTPQVIKKATANRSNDMKTRET